MYLIFKKVCVEINITEKISKIFFLCFCFDNDTTKVFDISTLKNTPCSLMKVVVDQCVLLCLMSCFIVCDNVTFIEELCMFFCP